MADWERAISSSVAAMSSAVSRRERERWDWRVVFASFERARSERRVERSCS